MSTSRRALLSVSDKHGVAEFARQLAELSFEFVSTGGTARVLREAGLTVTGISDLTGFPEIMDGRVKTLHPAVHGGLLARGGIDEETLIEHGIGMIDLLVVNLYPFERVTADPQCSVADAIENIDIGGPAMLRAAAKNHDRVAVVVDAGDYGDVIESYRSGGPAADLRRRLAVKAFAHTARYDAAISDYLRALSQPAGACPDPLVVSLAKSAELRYGENPHQRAALYVDPAAPAGTVAHARKLQGKPLSFNNLVDADTALECAMAFAEPACVIVKHANPCGVAIADNPKSAYEYAYGGDPTSAFGGVIAFNRMLDADTASAVTAQQFAEVIAAPQVDDRALAALASKPSMRVLECGPPSAGADNWDIRSIRGGLLLQSRDYDDLDTANARTVTARHPTEAELADLMFAWLVVRFVKSNAIVFARGGRTLGIGAGQMSRVVSTRIAAFKAEEEHLPLAGAVMASDAFFPFRDGIDSAAQHGISAVIQPGGSIRDDEVIAAANEHGIAMVFSGARHFRH
ncbi:bifunctional phosphoribosylaminoimidazolecarboxamide formyltransferase/IMP cyclohydrolase [Candidatus Rariloculus sp.]|uniref:bifunctional phosphoribosylaminoimidazolecarboxamide formyltransferase/IMP cyclohydrolase n=1 Tax=Candidatus Rariloculus sp. TaxID=3101265 RepID=UPI003D0CCA70